MRIAITGMSGLVGGTLAAALRADGHQAVALPRPEAGLDPALLDGCDGVVHLAGASVGARWSPAHRAAIRSSRVAGTARLVEALAACPRRPRVLVSVSATGYYGDAGDRPCPEGSPLGAGFLAGICRDWEAAAASAAGLGLRVAIPRLGVVLSRRGGALARMLPAFRWGLGGPLGDGRQWMPWIHLDDAVGVLRRCLDDERLAGPFNAVAGAVPQGGFARALGRALGRPAWLPAPAWALRLGLGDQARELLLASCRAVPETLTAVDHQWIHGRLDQALAAETAPPAPVTG